MEGMTRWDEVRKIHQAFPGLLPITLGTAFVATGILIGSIIFGGRDYITNVFTELISIFVTVLIVSQWNKIREVQNERARLLQESQSRSNPTALAAVEWLDFEDLLHGDHGILQGQNLNEANLENVNLDEANLRRSGLIGTNLRSARLNHANLEEAVLLFAELHGAKLRQANLSGAILGFVRLEEADLSNADLKGAIMDMAHLADATFAGATLPDGTQFVAGDKLGKFTDSNHPEFNSTRERIDVLRESMGLSDHNRRYGSMFGSMRDSRRNL